MSPTYEASARVLRELRKLPLEQRRAFRAARDEFVAALQQSPPQFPPGLRIKRVQGTDDVWELTFAPDGPRDVPLWPARATRRAAHRLAARRHPRCSRPARRIASPITSRPESRFAPRARITFAGAKDLDCAACATVVVRWSGLI